MAKKIINGYFVKNTSNGTFTDVCSLYDGVNVLAIEGLDAKGKSLNVYAEQWITGGTDFTIAADDGKITRENVDIKIVFVVGQRYANAGIDPQIVYDNFVNYMTETDVWIASKYFNKQVHCYAGDKFEPKTIKLHRGGNSYIMGEITLKTLEKPQAFSQANMPYDYIVLEQMKSDASVEETYAGVYHLIYDGSVQESGIHPDIDEQDILIYEPVGDDNDGYVLVRKSDLLNIINNGRYGSSIEILRGSDEYFEDSFTYEDITEASRIPRRVLRSYATNPYPIHIYDLFA